MVVFVDLDDPDEVEHQQHGHNTPFDMRDLINAHAARSLQHTSEKQTDEEEDEDDREHPNLNALSAVLGNYPIISEIARHLDLNSLHDLSRTCRQFRANLLQHRRQLILQTLRCVSDTPDPAWKSESVLREEADELWNTHGPDGIRIPRLTSGRHSSLAIADSAAHASEHLYTCTQEPQTQSPILNTTMTALTTSQHTTHPYTAAPAPAPPKSGSVHPAPPPSVPSIPHTCAPGPGDPATARTSMASAQV
ncbi:hypothetical protein KCU78_g14246, partial [Aureobasidium melanogenum]